jgi:mannosyltransferase OCH1-like enzyme
MPDIANSRRAIPLLFHQTWRDANIAEHSDFAEKSKAAVLALHPGCEYRLWTDRDIGRFMKREVRPAFPDVYDTYERLPKKIMKIDFVRYCWMYMLGGVYCDLDVVHLRPITPLIEPGGVAFVGRAWTTGGRSLPLSVHQAWLASCPQHPVWLEIMSFIRQRLDAGVTETLDLTGPNGVSTAIVTLQLDRRHPDVRVHPHALWFQPGCTKTPFEQAWLHHRGTHRWPIGGKEKLLAIWHAVVARLPARS